MKGFPLLKEVIRYQWYDLLFDRFYKNEYVNLPINDLWQDIGRRITFGWGLGVSGGICLLLFIALLRWVHGFWLIPVALLLLALALLLSSCASVVYLYFRLRRHYKEQAHFEKLEREGYGELHGELNRPERKNPDGQFEGGQPPENRRSNSR